MSDPQRQIADVLLDSAIVIAPLALGYFAGIAYLDAFLSAFSISIHEIEAPLATIVAHSYNVFTHSAFLAKLILIGAGVVAICIAFLTLRRNETIPKTTRLRTILAIALPAAAFLTFLGIKSSAEETARNNSHRIWHEQGSISIPRSSLKAVDNRLGVRQGLRLESCLSTTIVKHVIATPRRSYSICVIGNEGFLLTHDTNNDRYLPIRFISPCSATTWRRSEFCISAQ
ncbi:hypothetical protein [Stappia sp.]|uniref:hypothetical protein n=1 Tax=Stappia sp. TaxID=1870903 RepID=UPI003C7A2818